MKEGGLEKNLPQASPQPVQAQPPPQNQEQSHQEKKEVHPKNPIRK
jgi:hypothetical protein